MTQKDISYINQKINNLLNDYHDEKGRESAPLYADVKIRWNDGDEQEDIIRLDTLEDEDRVVYNCDGIDGLRELTTNKGNTSDFMVTDVTRLYGKSIRPYLETLRDKNVYEVQIFRYRSRDVTVQASSLYEAYEVLEKGQHWRDERFAQYDNERTEIIIKGEASQNKIERKLMAAPAGCQVFTLMEVTMRSLPIKAEGEEEAKRTAIEMIKNGFSLDNCRSQSLVIPSIMIIDNKATKAVEVNQYTLYDLGNLMRDKYPDGVTINLMRESVDSLMSLSEERTSLVGLVNDNENEIIAGYGELKAELRLPPNTYHYIYPDSDTYYDEDMIRLMDYDTAMATLMIYNNKDIAGARVSVDFHTWMLRNIYVEGVPYEKARDIIKTKGIKDDRSLKTELDRAKNQERISCVKSYMAKNGDLMLRCDIDGIPQIPERINAIDLKKLKSGEVSKEELCEKYFSGSLEEDNGIKTNMAR